MLVEWICECITDAKCLGWIIKLWACNNEKSLGAMLVIKEMRFFYLNNWWKIHSLCV